MKLLSHPKLVFATKFCIGGIAGLLIFAILCGVSSLSWHDIIGGSLSWIITLLVVLLAILVYFAPTINAYQRAHRNAKAIAYLNFFLGWTFLGWVAALVWSATADVKGVGEDE